jgi:hypothetical protein
VPTFFVVVGISNTSTRGVPATNWTKAKARLGGIYDKDKKTLRDDFDPNSNWAKHPAVMCSWRAAVFLARFVYTDLVGGLYMPDEIGTEEGEIDGNPMLVGVVENAA